MGMSTRGRDHSIGRSTGLSEVRRLRRRAARLHRGYRLVSALEVATQALAIQRRLQGAGPDTAVILNAIGEIHAELGDQSNAATFYGRSLRLLRGRVAHRRVQRVRLGAAIGLAAALRASGRYAESEAVGACSLAEAQWTFGDGSVEVAEALNERGMLYKYMGRFSEAVPLYRSALAIAQRELGAPSEAVANLYHNLGGLEHARRDFARGEPYARRALRIRRRIHGKSHPRVAADAAALGAILQARGKPAEAGRLYRGALAVFERTFGSNHYEVAVTLNNLAALLQSRGKLAQADRLYRRAIGIKSGLLGPDHPDVAVTLNNLALLCRASGRTHEAARLYARSLRIFRRACGPGHPSVATLLENYAALLRSEGETARAIRLQAQADGVRAGARRRPRQRPAIPTAEGLHSRYRITIQVLAKHRIGLIAAESVPPRHIVFEHGGQRPGRAAIRPAHAGPLEALSISRRGCHIDGRRCASYIGHSDSPNLRVRERQGRTLYVSTCAIRAGEQLSVDRTLPRLSRKSPRRAPPRTSFGG